MLTSSSHTGHPHTSETDVAIIGAGTAGLAAARHLTAAGLTVAVLEAESRIGGRMVTDQLDGYQLDRGVGMLAPDWPEVAGLPGPVPDTALTLRPFAPGALLRAADRYFPVGDLRLGSSRYARTRPRGLPRQRTVRNVEPCHSTAHWLRPRGPRGTLGVAGAARALGGRPIHGGRNRTAMSDALDLARLRAALVRLAHTSPERLTTRSELSAAAALATRGLPARTRATLVQPLLVALLSDPALNTSSRIADLTLRGFLRTGISLPAGGAAALPRLLAAGLPDGTIHTGVRARSIATNSVGTADHGTFGCRAVLLATGARRAAELLPGLRVPDFHSVTVLHHAVPESPMAAPALLVDADRKGPVNHTWVTTAVDPSRALPGRALVTSVVLGAQAADPVGSLDRAARCQLAELYGTSTSHWELLAHHHDRHAVPAMPAPHDARRPVRVLGGLYICGDHRETSGNAGALASARRASTEILDDFGLRPATGGAVPLRVVA